MAMESGEKDTIESNIKHILNECLITDVDIDELPVVDMEYYFLNLRARSVGEIVESKYKCENVVGEEVCGNVMSTKFNILDIQLEKPAEVSDLIKLTGDVGIKLKYPSFDVVERIRDAENVTDSVFELVIECIDYIYDKENMYYAYESTKEELLAFLESLTKDQFSKIEEFIENLPKLKKQLDIKCSKCGFEHKINIEGLESFF